MKTCERCGRSPRWLQEGTKDFPYPHTESFDYCAHCSKDLCPECLAQGCCKQVPAESGLQADCGEEASI